MKIRISVVYGDGQSRICGGAMRSYRKWYRAHAWPEVTSPEVTWLFPRTFFSRTFFPLLFFPVFLPRTFIPVLVFPVLFPPVLPPPRTFFPYFSPVPFFPYFFSCTFSKVSCFSSTWRYNTVHVPCGISIQTSPVGLPLEGWDARMRDLKGQKMNLFNQ